MPGTRYWAGSPAASVGAVARTDERPVPREELGVALLVVGRVDVGGGDAEDAQLGVVLEDHRQVVAVRPELEQLAHGQPRPVAERLAVHDQGILLDPLDGHRSAALVDQLEQGVALAGVAGEASMPAVDRRWPHRGRLLPWRPRRGRGGWSARSGGLRTGRPGRPSARGGGGRAARSTPRIHGHGRGRWSPRRARHVRRAARRRAAGCAGRPRRDAAPWSGRRPWQGAGHAPRAAPGSR